MPLTPFHLGPALLLGALVPRRLDLPTLLIASVIVDVRAALVLYGPLDGPVHGILTTFLGGTVVAVVLAGAILASPGQIDTVLDRLRLRPAGRPTAIFAGALVGVYSHVVLDSLLYADARPLLPFDWNPFLLGQAASTFVYVACLVAGLLGLGLFAVRYRRQEPLIL